MTIPRKSYDQTTETRNTRAYSEIGGGVVSNVITLGNITSLDLPTDRVLEECKGDCTAGVVVLGFDDDGQLYFKSSIADGGEVIWLLEMAKKHLLEVGEE